MKNNLTCLNRTSICYDDYCKDQVITCKPNEACVAMIGFAGNNLTKPVIRFANCFTDIECRNSLNQTNCIAHYDPTSPFVSDYYCCCNQPMCNEKFIIKELTKTSKDSLKSDSKSLVSPTEISVIVSAIIAFLVLLTLGILLIKSKYRKKLKLKQLRQHQQQILSNISQQQPRQNELPALVQSARISTVLINDEINNPLIDQSSTASSTTPSTSTISSINIENIKLIQEIAHGQFSKVWKAKFLTDLPDICVTNEDLCAVKVFQSYEKHSWLNEKEIYFILTENEFKLRFYGAEMFQIDKLKQYWIIMDYHREGSLFDYLKVNTVSWQKICNYSLSILNGLAYLHSEIAKPNSMSKPTIAHRDLKSKNIIVKSNGTCCIADFGLALALKDGKLNTSDIKSQVGTRRYMSPELLEGAITFTKDTLLRIDVYACSLILWELINRGNFYDEVTSAYEMPYEKELGLYPTLEEMQDFVVNKNKRPVIKSTWLKHSGLPLLVKTIEECWDIHVEARLSSECAATRLRKNINIEYV